MTEIQLAEYVIRWLEGRRWDVYQEVKAGPWEGRVADIVAVRGPLLWVIECKRSLGLTVLAQANGWPALKRSVATPAAAVRGGSRRATRRGAKRSPSRRSSQRLFAERVCESFGVGLLEVARDGTTSERIEAPLLRRHRAASDALRRQLCDEHKRFAPAGSAGGVRWSPYRKTMGAVLAIVRASPGATIDEIMNALENQHHYPNRRTARAAIGSALRIHELWCFVDEFSRPQRFYHVDDRPRETHGGWLFDLTAESSPDEAAHSSAAAGESF